MAAHCFQDKPAIVFCDSVTIYVQLKHDADAIAGYLHERYGIASGDRVLLLGQNCPQFVAAYYSILRAGGVVVPANAMSTAAELKRYVNDSGAKTAIVA